MNELFESNLPEPKKIGVWAEGTRIEAKEFVIPKKSKDSSDDIPTIPDLDDLQDILDKDVSSPPLAEHNTDSETANTLAEVGGGIGASPEGIEAAVEVLKSHMPQVELDTTDTIWTIDSLLAQLAEDVQDVA